MSRVDAFEKATGNLQYVADLSVPEMVHAAVVRSTMPHARITGIDVSEAVESRGVIGIYTASDLVDGLYGRAIVDTPILAREKVRFVGERVAAVVAETREEAEAAAAMVIVDYEPLQAAVSPSEALAAEAPAIHDAPWTYKGSVAKEGDHPNVIYRGTHGDREEFETALGRAAHVVDATYRTQGVHQGYIEPQACIASYKTPESVELWLTNKNPYRTREILSHCLGIATSAFEMHHVYLGGDFGGKGSPGDSPLCVELSRLVGRPVKLVLRYSEELIATNPRHPAEIRVRIGCNEDGRIVAASMQAVLNSGAYGSFTANAPGPGHAVMPPGYRIPIFYSEMLRVYTNTVPRGHMRAPGAPQGIFAFESAMDELAVTSGLSPDELRRRNVLVSGEADVHDHKWAEHRGIETLDAAMTGFNAVEPPDGWLYGRGMVLYSTENTTSASTSLRLTPRDDGCVCVETPLVETGVGSHTVLRELLVEELGFRQDQIEIVGASTDELPRDAGAGASRVTAGIATLVDAAAKAWHNRTTDEPILVEVDEKVGPLVGSYIVQIAQVAIDPDTGEFRVLELLNAVDVANIINPKAHQMQIDGGSTMGVGFACLEDLNESEGQVWAANLGEFKLPSSRDVPPYRSILVPGGLGVGTANVKNIGETTTPPVAAAIANAIFDACGKRIRELPLTAEKIYSALRGESC